jgi:cytochrome P450
VTEGIVLAQQSGISTPDSHEDEFWDRCPLHAIEQATRRDGPVFTVHRPGKPPRVHVGDPAALRAVFVDHESDLLVRGSSLLYPLVGEFSLGVLNGAEHRRFRKVLTPPIHGELLRRHDDRIRSITKETIARNMSSSSVALRDIAPTIALRVMILYCFGELPSE